MSYKIVIVFTSPLFCDLVNFVVNMLLLEYYMVQQAKNDAKIKDIKII